MTTDELGSIVEDVIGRTRMMASDVALAAELRRALQLCEADLLFVVRDARSLLGQPWLGSLPPRFVDGYAALGGAESDPTIAAALHRRGPFYWHDIWKQPNQPSAARALAALYAAFGLETGLSVPVATPTQGCDVVNISLQQAVTGDAGTLLRIACIVHIVWWRYYQMNQPEFIPTMLTPREFEVLRWIRAGKSARDIATITGSTQRAVEHHASNILLKLDAGDKVSAVLTAIRRGIIPL